MRSTSWILVILCLLAAPTAQARAAQPQAFPASGMQPSDVAEQIRQLQQRLDALKQPYQVEMRVLEQAQLMVQVDQMNPPTGNGFGATLNQLNQKLQQTEVTRHQNNLKQLDLERQEVTGQLNALLQLANRR
jgi:hypothetical protein